MIPTISFSTTMIGWIPFLQPAGSLGNLWWLLMIPLILGISIAYRATHDASIDQFWQRVFVFVTKSTLAMGSLALVMYLFVYWVIPNLQTT
jgi:high-affinity Fe2+/Pb2+ permease